MIPAEAVEAALKLIRSDAEKALTCPLPELIERILEAAAPPMLAAAWDEGIEAGVDGSVPECDYARNPYRNAGDGR